ncbi:MAG: PEGA domain-containing protein [Deltaproteobacteria bacterium]|nr:PEGA domain-containing protein [Deltaproteobacteria bacterium]
MAAMLARERECMAAALLAALAALAAAAQAEPPGSGPAAPACTCAPAASAPRETDLADRLAGPDLAQAKQLFGQGNVLLKAADYQGALEFFTRSRALVASGSNTRNAAMCLQELGRLDEALELYDELLASFGQSLTAEEQAAVSWNMALLRPKLGSIEVRTDAFGSLTVDGRLRGKLPLLFPVRVLPGRHDVRVIEPGYGSFRATVDVAAGQTASVDARLEPLAAIGRLLVDDPALAGADVYVDGTLVGKTPWEGMLEPGAHLYFVRLGDVGSAPRTITVVKGQSVVAPVKTGPLGPEMRVAADPATAQLVVDGVAVGTGRWQGRLPTGRHSVEAHELGYFPEQRQVVSGPDGEPELALRLRADESHPRWGGDRPGSRRGKILLEVFGGVGLSHDLGSEAESCGGGKCEGDPTALGFALGARAGYEPLPRLSIEAAGGYLSLSKELRRDFQSSFSARSEAPPTVVQTSYHIADNMRLSGPFAAGGVGYRQPLGRHLELRSHLLVGALFAHARDSISGSAAAAGRTLPVAALGSEAGATSTDLLVMPEVEIGLHLGGFSAGAGLAVALFALDGPRYQTGDIIVLDDQCGSNPTSIDCAPGTSFAAAERAYGPFLMWIPRVSAGYAF